ncbi:chorismate synthase [Desulfolucanica intricata]|uniref:chorismate synthase n=1 Tax=Desulfolucanica intricata TaxID=1285191 RepID=UPI00082D7660|nr:chorismate synthase [Desulfolucanica intricata]
MLRYFTAGESHGPALTAILEGIPAGLEISPEYIDRQLARRQQGYGRGGRMKIERDRVKLLSGVRGGLTLGSPVTLQVENTDWVNWEPYMSPVNADYEPKRVAVPRPGHGDLVGAIKYGHEDLRNVLERASARETAARVAVCTVARKLIEYFGMEITGHVVQIGSIRAEDRTLKEIKKQIEKSELLCADPLAEEKMKKEIDDAKEKGDSLGGIFEIIVTNVPVGLGSHVQWDRKLDGRIAWSLMSVQAIKGVEIGLGFTAATLPGSRVHDEIFTGTNGYYRGSNNAGGIEAGISNGQNIVVRAAMKPIATLYSPLRSVNLRTGVEELAAVERSDICAVPAAAVVGEAVVAFEMARAFLEKFGGDSIAEIDARMKIYREQVSHV